MRPVKSSVCPVTHQHPLQTAKIVTLSPPVHHLLETDSMAQPYELLANIYGLPQTFFLEDVCRETADRVGKQTEQINKTEKGG